VCQKDTQTHMHAHTQQWQAWGPSQYRSAHTTVVSTNTSNKPLSQTQQKAYAPGPWPLSWRPWRAAGRGWGAARSNASGRPGCGGPQKACQSTRAALCSAANVCMCACMRVHECFRVSRMRFSTKSLSKHTRCSNFSMCTCACVYTYIHTYACAGKCETRL